MRAGVSRKREGRELKKFREGGCHLQVVPQTQTVLLLSVVGVLVTFGMQFALAWYIFLALVRL